MPYSPFFHLAGLQRPGVTVTRLDILQLLFENPNYHYTEHELKEQLYLPNRAIKHILDQLKDEDYITATKDNFGITGYKLNTNNKTIKEIHKAENRINGIGETTLEEFFKGE